MGGAVGVVDNYTAELMAILAICEIAPPEKRIKIYTDSTSSIDAIQSFSHLTTRKQNRQASRPTLKSITDAIHRKKLCIQFEHVKSHQPITNWQRHGNDIADRIAKISSAYNQNPNFWANLEMGEPYVCMKKIETNEVLVNDPRRQIAEILRQKQIQNWQDSSQGIDIRSGLEKLQKWKRETKGTEIEDFGLIFWTRLFPTAINIRKIASKQQIWPVSCVFCHTDCVDNDEHLLKCPSTWKLWKEGFHRIENFLNQNPKEQTKAFANTMQNLNLLNENKPTLSNFISENRPKFWNARSRFEVPNIKILAEKLQISSMWTVNWTEIEDGIPNVRTEKTFAQMKQLNVKQLTSQLIRDLKNESAIITGPQSAEYLVRKFQKEIEYTLQKRDTFRLVFLCEQQFEVPQNLIKYSAKIAESMNYKWTILTNPCSLTLDQTDWYQVRCEMQSYTMKKVNQALKPEYLFKPTVKFPNWTRSKEKQQFPEKEIPKTIKILSCINPFKSLGKNRLRESIFSTIEEQENFRMRNGMELLSGTVFYPEELESNLMNLVSIKALNFIKQETRNVVKTIIKKRFKWMKKIKTEISKKSLENMWEFTMGSTNLNMDHYITKNKSTKEQVSKQHQHIKPKKRKIPSNFQKIHNPCKKRKRLN